MHLSICSFILFTLPFFSVLWMFLTAQTNQPRAIINAILSVYNASIYVLATLNTSFLRLSRSFMHMRKLRLREFKVHGHSQTINIWHMRDLKPGLFNSKAYAFSIQIGYFLRIYFPLFPAIATFLSLNLSLEIKSKLVFILWEFNPETVSLFHR